MATAVAAENHKIHPVRKIIAVILAIILIAIAWSLYTRKHNSAPGQSTTQTRPNSTQNVPPGGQVNQGGNPYQDTTPSPNGTNGNPMSSQ